MGLFRIIAGAGIVFAVVAYGESDAPAPSEAVKAAKSAAAFCQGKQELCAAAATGALATGIEAARPTPPKKKTDASGAAQSRVKGANGDRH